MPSLTHFAPALTSGGLLIGASSVATQPSGLVEVSVEYICRRTDLAAQIAKFFIDAPPPIFPSRAVAAANLQEGKLFLVNYTVNEQYGVATIQARYAGATKTITPFKTFDYNNFSVSVPLYTTLQGYWFGSAIQGFAFGAGATRIPEVGNNDFNAGSSGANWASVTMTGRLEVVRFSYATLAATPPPASVGAASADFFAEINYEANSFRVGDKFDREGRFGGPFVDGVQEELTALEVANKVAQLNGAPGIVPRVWFESIVTSNVLAERGVAPLIRVTTSRRIEAVTPSLYVIEIEYRPEIDALRM
jgi:hypothetical protein